MTKEEREFLRVKVSSVRAYFNFLKERGSCSLFLYMKRKTISPAEAGAQENPFQEFVVSALQRLESKVDFLMRELQRERHGVAYEHQAEVLDIGGGGLKLLTSAPCPLRSFLDICVFAECGNSLSLYIIGQVQWVEEGANDQGEAQYRVGVSFVEIDEEDRETLFRAIFDLDRRQKRQKSIE